LPRLLPEILPRGAVGNKSVHAVHEVARKSVEDAILCRSIPPTKCLEPFRPEQIIFIIFSLDVSSQSFELQSLPAFSLP
jgi:hypothetical protein